MRPLLLLLSLLPLLSCAPTVTRVEPADDATPMGPPQIAAPATAARVVLMTFDGLGADALARQNGLTAFAHLARSGATARIVPVNPTLTAPAHASILTGAQPQVHGIVSNRFHIPGTPVEQTARGLDVEPDVETLVTAARRQGKRVGVAPFPSLDASTPSRTADFGFAWTQPLTRGRIVQLTRDDFKREWVPPTWTSRPQRRTSFSPIMRARVEWSVSRELRADVDVVAYDTSDDGRANYDLYVVETEERELEVDARGWFAVAREHHGSWSKLLRTSPELDVRLYWGPISRTRAWPESYREMIDHEIGFWPGSPEEEADVDAATFAEQIERLADFLARAQTLTIRRVPFDLLLLYQPAVDQAGHHRLRDQAVVQRAFLAADRAAAAVGGELDTHRDALIVTGDHGLMPVERSVRMNRLLAEHGFAPRWRAYATNAVAHLYRFDGPDDTDAVVHMLTATGHFERVEKKGAGWHRHSGDIVVTAHPTVALSPSDAAPAVAEPASEGQHGGLNTHRELQTVLFAAGAGVPRGELGEIAQTKIARFVAGLLGISPPAAAE